MASPATAMSTAVRPAAPAAGHQIFIFSNIETNQTIYSLTRFIKVNKALKQTPFMGKKTKETTIRKDMWRPLAFVTFPNRQMSVEAYRNLREFQVRHQHEWTAKSVGATPKYNIQGFPGLDKYDAGRKARNQKANTIADLAFVLQLHNRKAEMHDAKTDKEHKAVQAATDQGTDRIAELREEMLAIREDARNGNEAALTKYKQLKVEKMRIKRHLRLPRPDMAMEKKYHPLNDNSIMPKRGRRRQMRLKAQVPRFTQGVRVAWADKHDLEHAQEWPATVVHDQLQTSGSSVWAPAKPILPDQVDAVTEVATAGEEAASKDRQTLLDRVIVRMRYGAGGSRPDDSAQTRSA